MTRVCISTNGRHILAYTPPEHSRHVRRIPGARFNNTLKVWVIKPSRVAWELLGKIPGVEFQDVGTRPQDAQPLIPLRAWPSWYRPSTVPYKHQMAGSALMYGRRESAIFAEPGTGKTKMAIDAISARYAAGEIDRLLVAAPKSVRGVWVREFATHCPVEHDIQLFKVSKNPIEFGKGLGVLVVSSESLSTANAYNAAIDFVRGGRCALVADEAHMFKNHKAKRTENLTTLAGSCVAVTVMTGTPVANALVDLYSQFGVLNTDIIGYPDYWSFCERYCRYGGYENRQIVGYENEDELMDSIRPFTMRASKSQCLDLPPKVYQTRTLEMTPVQKTHYKELSEKLRLANLETKNSLDLMLRLHQIAGGFMPSVVNGVTHYQTFCNTKVAEVVDIAEDCDESMVIWCAYRHEVREVVNALEERWPGEVVKIHGDIGEIERIVNVERMQNKTARFLVGIASSGGAGITVTAATVMVYYSNSFSYIHRAQSEDRCHRIGQTKTVTIIDLVTEKTIDDDIVAALSAKCDLAHWVAQRGSLNLPGPRQV